MLPRLAGGSGEDLVGFGCFGCVGFEVGLEDVLMGLEELKRDALLLGVTAPACVILKIPGPGPSVFSGPFILPPLLDLFFLLDFTI